MAYACRPRCRWINALPRSVRGQTHQQLEKVARWLNQFGLAHDSAWQLPAALPTMSLGKEAENGGKDGFKGRQNRPA
jgi:hypothetical protein